MRVILVSKNFAINMSPVMSHTGLGITGTNNAKTLQAHGIEAEVWQVVSGLELIKRLDATKNDRHPITHVVISAPWIPTDILQDLCQKFHRIHFAVNCHSNVGFLQADRRGTELLRQSLDLETTQHRFSVAGNSKKFVTWVERTFGSRCVYLPNLYFMHPDHPRRQHSDRRDFAGPLKIGIFGATRELKNVMTGVGAAMEMAHQMKAQTEIYLSAGRLEGAGNRILSSVREMCFNFPNVTLKEVGWKPWPEFRRLVGMMHLMIQVSFTESFNVVVADGCFMGVPSVVSSAIEWAPDYWKANSDITSDIARVGQHLLHYPQSAHDGLIALESYVENGVRAWKRYLNMKE